jgi:2'-5' RNA ligase
MIRAFIAIPFEEEAKSAILNVIENLKASIKTNVRWVARDNIHLTLKFLGYINEQQLNRAKHAMDDLKDINAFKIDLLQIGCFPSISSPRIIWIGIKQQDNVKQLFDIIERHIHDINKEDRTFSAHITIGRVKGTINVHELEKIKKLWNDTIINSSFVDRVVLFQSILGSKGAVYSPLYDVKLKKEAL